MLTRGCPRPCPAGAGQGLEGRPCENPGITSSGHRHLDGCGLGSLRDIDRGSIACEHARRRNRHGSEIPVLVVLLHRRGLDRETGRPGDILTDLHHSLTLAANSPGIVNSATGTLENVTVTERVAYPVPGSGQFVGPAQLPFSSDAEAGYRHKGQVLRLPGVIWNVRIPGRHKLRHVHTYPRLARL